MSWQLSGSEAIDKASAAARNFAEIEWLTEDETARLCIIVEELVANLYDHAGVTKEDRIDLTLSCEPDGVHVVLLDRSPPFDPRSVPLKDRPERGGGAGIDIVKAWSLILDYQATGHGNRLEVVMPTGAVS